MNGIIEKQEFLDSFLAAQLRWYGDEEKHILPEPDPSGHVAIAIENCHRKKVDLPMKNDAFPFRFLYVYHISYLRRLL
jgi:hypothetical protein